MTTSGEDYFYQHNQQVLYIDEVNDSVGILTDVPMTTLDVRGDISSCNVYGDTLIFNSGAISEIGCINLEASSNIYCDTLTAYSNVYCNTLTAYSNIHSQYIHADHNVTGCNIIADFNLGAFGISLSNVCPNNSVEVFGFGNAGYIDASWVKTDPDFMGMLDTMWNIAQSGYDLFNFVKGFAPDPAGTAGLANDLKQNLEDALDQLDEEPGSNQLAVSFWNVKNRPFVATTTFDMGVKGDLYLNESKSIYSFNSSKYIANYNNNQSFLNTTGKDLLLNVGTKQAYLNELYVGCNTYIGLSNQFKINNWFFSSNVISNNTASNTLSSIQFSTSNNWIGIAGSLSVVNQVSTPIVNTEQIISTNNGYIQFNTSNLTTKYQDGVFGVSYLKQYPNKFDFITQMSNLGGSNLAAQTVQASVSTTGLWVASNISSPSPLILQSILPSNVTGTLTLEADKLRYYNSNNYIVWSVNSNGMFLNQKFSIYGQPEYLYNDILSTSFSNFGRLECGISNGLNYGYGLSYDPLSNNYNVFNASYRGELSTLNSSTLLMNQIVNSNATLVAPIKLGTFTVSNDGSVFAGNLQIKNNGNLYWGSNPILISGKIQPNCIAGFNDIDVSKLGDGKLSWSSFNSSTSAPINPFQSSTAVITI
jgi:hypothetical protein